MKKILFVICVIIIFLLGINVGSENDRTKAEIIQDKITRYENGEENINIDKETIRPNILNTVATKCSNTIDAVVDKVLKAIIK